ncbi:DNA-(apurinic or apyrimidinic site) endonuclease 2 [Aplysia californica]|uniref:DNA-(apurinic or apyrimidinic site) endonuclease n=1 Tax=Aplysia californica TaxID=6500 RepID=A0ABM0KAG7_APLCA|nr:DNA-(apurinic or apyrimidinic site) endonuclease 2 [Aplysia californica]
MKVLTWNINGIRAGRGKTSLKVLLDSLAADIICLQETKVTRDMLDEPTAIVDGYEAYFSFSRKRTGYSGTANYCVSRTGPVKAEEGLTGRLYISADCESLVGHYGDMEHLSDGDLDALDAEGRCIITQHKIRLAGEEKEVAIINVYVPRVGEDREDRHEYKVKFLGMLQGRAEALLEEGIHVIILGDLNLTHKPLDNPEYDDNFQVRPSRVWINNILQAKEQDSSLPPSTGMISELCPGNLKGGRFSDVFRQLHPQKDDGFTNWNTATDARKANFGRRLDYILVNLELAKYVTSCEIMAEVEGSDHCPVVVTLSADPVAASVTPNLCTKLMPEFRGQQQKLSSFFSKTEKFAASSLSSSPVQVDSDSIVLSSSQEDSGNVLSCSPFTKSKSLPPQVSEKSKLKRNSSAVDNTKNKKLKKNDTGSKQASLISFFSSSSSSKSDKVSNNSKASLNVQRRSDSASKNNTIEVRDDKCIDNSVKAETLEIVETVQLGEEGEVNKLCDSSTAKQEVPLRRTSTNISSSSSSSVAPINPPPTKSSASVWKSLLGGLPPPPLCPGHKEPCVLKTVKKAGPNKNKQFYSCPRPDGAPGKPEFRCNFFQWLNDKKKKKT